MTRYLKSITALVTGWIGWGAVVIASAPAAITASEWLGLAVATATALGVYAVPNTPPTGGDGMGKLLTNLRSTGPAGPSEPVDPAVWVVPDAAHQAAAALAATPAKEAAPRTRAKPKTPARRS